MRYWVLRKYSAIPFQKMTFLYLSFSGAMTTNICLEHNLGKRKIEKIKMQTVLAVC